MKRMVPQFLIAILLGAGCGSVCPSGSTLKGGPPPVATAQYCQEGEKVMENVPVPGRDYGDALGIRAPTARGEAGAGPYLEWFEHGPLRKRGGFARGPDGAPVPHGVWTSFHSNGERESEGRYQMGEPVGCFGAWDESGELATFKFAKGEYRETSCPMVLSTAASDLADRYKGGATSQALGSELFSVSFESNLLGSDLALSSPDYSAPGHSAKHLRITARRSLSLGALGLSSEVQSSSRDDVWSAAFGAIASVPVPVPPDRLSGEITAGLGARAISVLPEMNEMFGHLPELFWMPFASLEAGVGVKVTDLIAIYLSASVEQGMSRDEKRRITYCDPFCREQRDETWQVGGTSARAGLGVRFLVW